MTPEADNWGLLDPQEFRTELKELEDSESPQLVVPIPRRFGGEQEEDEEAVLEADEGFEIAKSKAEAEEQRKVLEEAKDAPAKSPVTGFSSEDFELEQKRQEAEIKRRNELMVKQSQELKDKEKQKIKAAKEFSNWLA
eukprot:TRINITY_DN1096_c0_g2_i2.p2 TRINITY_DN1096_c0_g2~~TRINITY_DN1096_c0_g2_i2.p2  ORF type:complete len:138 (-),score=81.24 TRINITY_DN1096_c0_g2_i2:402-815(-)